MVLSAQGLSIALAIGQPTLFIVDVLPIAPSVADQSGTVGTSLSVTLNPGTSGNLPLSYAVAPLPTGLSFNANTRVISGTPLVVGTTIVIYRVIDNDGDSDSSRFDFAIAAGVPSRPATPTIISVGNTDIDVAWIEPNNNGATITRYSLRHRETGTSGWTRIDNITTTSHQIIGLVVDTMYDVQVRAINAIGNSPWSPTGNGRTKTGLSPVLNGEATREGRIGGAVSFRLPTATGGDLPVTYSMANLPDGLAFNATSHDG